ncbi:MAG: helix-turn-helix domain-containing protein [Deltaproteobacteria bacterium]|nr:helix-turn-helix domain-containing protein [Deltaproteobacteria bacterium]
MLRTAEKPSFNEEEAAVLRSWANSRTFEARMVRRARIILTAADGESEVAIAASLGITVFTVGKRRRRFIGEVLEGLSDRSRSGKPPKHAPSIQGTQFFPGWRSPRPRDSRLGTERRRQRL